MILADQIIERDVSELVPYANNSRKHTEEQITAIASSIKEFGFLNGFRWRCFNEWNPRKAKEHNNRPD